MAGLLERDDLLAALGAALAEGGRLVFVGGEAGAGKTALVRTFATRADAPVLHGACENLTTPIPLGPFADIAAEAGAAFADLVSSRADARAVARALLAELSDPLVVVLEDVHWADEATLDALRVLGRRVGESRGLVLATYRDDEVEAAHPLRVVLGELASAAGVSRLTVPPGAPPKARIRDTITTAATAMKPNTIRAGDTGWISLCTGSCAYCTVRKFEGRSARFGMREKRSRDTSLLSPG